MAQENNTRSASSPVCKKPVESASSDLELTITRIFDAPRDLVYRAWADIDQALKWWGPRGFTVPFHEFDLRPGGGYRVCMRSAQGTDHWQRGSYREIVPPERIVFTSAWEDADGKPGRETLVTLTFFEEGNKTRFTLHQASFNSRESRDGHRGGWSEALDKLAEFLAER